MKQPLMPTLYLFLIAVVDSNAQDKEGLPDTQAQRKPRLTVSKDTTVLTEPITADGYVDYIAALEAKMRRGVTPENNANAGLRRLLGNVEIGVRHRAEYYRKLGIPQPKQDAPLLVRFGDLADEARDQLQKSMEAPWTAEDLPIAAQWIELNEGTLAQAREAIARPNYYSPIFGNGSMYEILLPDAQSGRSFSRLLTADAMNCIATGGQGAAIENLIACRRLNGHLGNEWTVIHGLVGYAICSMSAVAEEEFLNAAKPNLGKLKFWRRQLKTVRPVLTMSDRIDHGERWAMLDALGRVDRGEDLGQLVSLLSIELPIDQEAAGAMLGHLANPDLDFNKIARNLNLHFDRLTALLRTDDVTERENLAAAMDKDIDSRKSRLKMTARQVRSASDNRIEQWIEDFFLAAVTPAWKAIRTAELRHIARLRVLEGGWALSAWYADNKTWPESVGQLAPKYIPATLLDPFTGKPLLLHIEGKTCRVYSVGPNKIDQDGEKSNDRDGDIVVELRR